MESRNWKGGEKLEMDKSIKNVVKSSMLKAGKRTYFFDVKLSQNNTKYLKITESSFEGEGKERKYNSFLLFPDQIAGFQKNLEEISNFLAQ